MATSLTCRSTEAQVIASANVCAYQGVPGAFSEDAAVALVGARAPLRPCPTLADVFDALTARRVGRAVVPIENTLAGPVPGCADLMARHGVRVVAERAHHITQALVAPAGVSLGRIRRVLSHPVALAQCTRFLHAHPLITAHPTSIRPAPWPRSSDRGGSMPQPSEPASGYRLWCGGADR